MIEIFNEIANSTLLFIVGAWFGLVITNGFMIWCVQLKLLQS